MLKWVVSVLIATSPIAAQERFFADGPENRGEPVTCELPTTEHLRNKAGRDGLGLCVFTSVDHAARWANESTLVGFRDYMTQQPGGGWPEKLDRCIRQICTERGTAIPEYVQHTGGDPEFLRLALKTGRYVSVTYNGRDGVFYRGPIAHMVNLVHLSSQFAGIQDNNFPGQWLWMSPTDFLDRWKGGGAWAVVLLKPGPPPIPKSTVDVVPSIRQVQPVQCGTAACRNLPTEFFSVNPTPNTMNLEWKPDSADSGYFYLYHGNRQIGTWHPDGKGYRELTSDGRFSEPKSPPIPLPEQSITNFGIDPDRIPKQDGYARNGLPISRRQAFEAIGTLSDDSDKLRLTIIGDSKLQQQVQQDLKTDAALKNWSDKLLVQAYSPEHWAVKNVGLEAGVTLQAAGGEDGKSPVLFRIRQYRDANQLAVALRRVDPKYDAKNDPDPDALRLPIRLPKWDDMPELPGILWAILGGIAYWFGKKRMSPVSEPAVEKVIRS
jgi:hypothetical protein